MKKYQFFIKDEIFTSIDCDSLNFNE